MHVSHMHVFTCMLMPSHVCMHVQCTGACIHKSTCGHTIHTCMDMCTCKHVYTCTHACTCVNSRTHAAYTCATCVWTPMPVHAQMWVPTHSVLACRQPAHMYTVCTHMHTLTSCVDTHTHAYTCTHPALRTHCRCTRWLFHQRGDKMVRVNEAEKGIKDTPPPPPRARHVTRGL